MFAMRTGLLHKFVCCAHQYCCMLQAKVLAIQVVLREHLSSQLGEDAFATERGKLQLALDIEVLANVLAGPPPEPPADNDRRSASSDSPLWQLHRRLSEHLDPIDWATYAPFLRKHAEACVKQQALLLGLLLPVEPTIQVRWNPHQRTSAEINTHHQ